MAWSQDEVAQRLGVSRSAVSTYEKGTRQPQPKILKRLETLEQNPSAAIAPEEHALRSYLDRKFEAVLIQLSKMEGTLMNQRPYGVVEGATLKTPNETPSRKRKSG